MAKKDLRPSLKTKAFTVKGKEYKLAYSFRGLRRAEDEIRKAGYQTVNLLAGLANVWATLGNEDIPGASVLNGLLYGCLVLTNAEIALDDASDLITIDNMTDVVQAIREAYILSIEEPQDDSKKHPEVESQNQ